MGYSVYLKMNKRAPGFFLILHFSPINIPEMSFFLLTSMDTQKIHEVYKVELIWTHPILAEVSEEFVCALFFFHYFLLIDIKVSTR